MLIFLTLPIIVITCVVYYFHHSFSYWKRKNVFYIKPYFPLGSIGTSFPKYAWEQTANFYKIFKSSGARYGGLYFLSIPVFMPVNPENIREVMSKYFEHFQDRGIYCEEEIEPMTAHLFALSGMKWKSMRQKLTPTFTTGKIKNMFNIILQCSYDIKTVLDEAHNKNKALDIKELVSGYTTDVIASCAFGIECKSILNPNEDFRRYGRIFLDNNFLQKTKVIMGFISPALLKLFKIPFFKPIVANYIISVVKDTITYRETNNIERKDFMDLLIKIKNKQNISDEDFLSDTKTNTYVNNTLESDEFTPAQIAAQAFVFYVAGFETSSTTTTFLMLELAQNQDIQNKLREEINTVLTKYNGQATYEAVMEMTYMDSVINETMRKYPPVYMLNRICTKDFTMENSGITIEKGTRVIIPVYGLHHDPEFFPNPDVFDPNRFSKEETEKQVPYTYLPFGEGPRFCIGMRFGLMQTKIGIISLLKDHKYTIHDTTIQPIELVSNLIILSLGNTLYLKVHKLD